MLEINRSEQAIERIPHKECVIAGVGVATPATAYSQLEVLEALGVTNAKVRSLFLNSAIDRRFLVLPKHTNGDVSRAETQGDLLDKQRSVATAIGSSAITDCLTQVDAVAQSVDFLCCVTTTGFLTPGLSALISKELCLAPSCARLDVVGMGCNAGLNALNVVAGWSRCNPGKLAILLCAEVCSAGYVVDGSLRTAVVNSLFGDGAAAIAVVSPITDREIRGPRIIKFQSHLITTAIDAMRYDWDESQGKFSFFLDPAIPYVIGENVSKVVSDLLSGTNLRRGDVNHWIVHSGGKKVIDAIKINLGLSSFDLRHTIGVLRHYGNVSSGSFLFSYKRLLEERKVAKGDYAVMMTMGPGSTIEAALLEW